MTHFRLAGSMLALLAVAACRTTPEAGDEAARTTAGAQAAYPQCTSQSEAEPQQRAPSFFTTMAQCRAESTQPAATLAQQAGAGSLNEKGDCAFENGVTCHFHTAREFLADPGSQQEQGVGELHCIVPSAEPISPVVFGAHIRCREPAGGAAAQRCSSELLEVFSRCNSWRCCDDGTLTKAVSAQTAAEQTLQPDFRICEGEVLEIDCGLLEGMTPWDAYVPAHGGQVAPVFTPNQG